MRLGVDFGTTRIVVAAADRGNYPLVSFETEDATFDWMPPLVAVSGTERKYGWEAWHMQAEPGWTVLRSLKRYLEDAGPETRLSVDGEEILLLELLIGLAAAIRRSLIAAYGREETFEIMLGVPANANSNQRFLTVDAFRRAGFAVLGLLNEPSAASIEFGHRQHFSGRLLVYDLGGGTFDASLVELSDKEHRVVTTSGISTLGGDDFDHVLAEMAIGEDGLGELDAGEMFRLEEECRRQKEALHPNTRRITLDLDEVRAGLGQKTIGVAEFYEQCAPLIEQTIAASKKVADQAGEVLDGLYVTGGGSELPLVARLLREEFGRKVKRSEYTRSATAIGLAIQADSAAGYALSEVFTRHFGVWREANEGERMLFDPIFPRGTQLPVAGSAPLEVSRTYLPVHNIGHFRYLEAAHIDEHSQPSGDVTIWDEIEFPFDPDLAEKRDLTKVAVKRDPAVATEEIEERYTCDSAGIVNVAISNLTSGYKRQFKLGRWSAKAAAVKPVPKKRVRRAAE